MINKIKRLLRGKGNKHNNLIKVRDSSGKTVYINDRRNRQRKPFRGRPVLAEPLFERFSAFILDSIGINLGPENRQMIESRLTGRLRALDMATFDEYLGYLCSRRGINAELDHFIDSITTHKTHFYRQPGHYEFILRKAVPELLQSRSFIRAWSVGCSSGEEPYTIAMVLAEYASKHGGFNFTVVGSDISALALERAEQAEYDWGSVANLPTHCRSSHMTRAERKYRVSPGIRKHVTFRRLNLLDDSYDIEGPVELAFYRNVGIYFDAAEQSRILKRICHNMAPGGYLLLGHAENLEGFSLPLKRVEDSVYIRE